MIDRFDVAVVGGGIAGTAAGYELAAHASVVVLEQEETCGHHSTGRSAAVFTECYGEYVVRSLAISSRSFLEDPPNGFSEAPILSPRPLLFIGRPDQSERLTSELSDFRSMVPSVRAVSPAEAAAMCPAIDESLLDGGIVEPGSRDLDVHGLHLGFQNGLRRRGGVIRTKNTVTGGSPKNALWRLQTTGGEVEASTVVNAAGAWGDHVAELCGVEPIGLAPMRRTAFTFDPPQGDHNSWPMVIDIDEQFYFKPEGPHLLGSPADETPMPPHDVRHTEIDVATAIDRIGGATTMDIRHVRSAWAGLRTFAPDRKPVNGWDPDARGFYWLVGQGGFGIKTSPAMARHAAGQIIGSGVPDDLSEAGISASTLSLSRLR